MCTWVQHADGGVFDCLKMKPESMEACGCTRVQQEVGVPLQVRAWQLIVACICVQVQMEVLVVVVVCGCSLVWSVGVSE